MDEMIEVLKSLALCCSQNLQEMLHQIEDANVQLRHGAMDEIAWVGHDCARAIAH